MKIAFRFKKFIYQSCTVQLSLKEYYRKNSLCLRMNISEFQIKNIALNEKILMNMIILKKRK